jgi:hypothetical protein
MLCEWSSFDRLENFIESLCSESHLQLTDFIMLQFAAMAFLRHDLLQNRASNSALLSSQARIDLWDSILLDITSNSANKKQVARVPAILGLDNE